jgi:hypothetical protein
MKRLNNILLILIGAMLVAFFVYFLPNYNRIQAEKKEIQQAIDSVKAIAESTPDTIRDTTILTEWDTITRQTHDTVFFERDTDTTRIYYDTLRTSSLRIWTASRVKGTMDWNSIAYQSRTPRREVILSEQIPTPYPVYKEVESQNLYVTPQVGVSRLGVIYGVGALWDRKNLNYTANFYRLQGESILTVGTAIKF